MSDNQPQWDEAFADDLRGSVVLVGIARQSSTGETLEQFFGTVERADEGGIELILGGSRAGESYFLPPDPRAFHPAQPGSYRLRQTGEVIEDPDFTTTWTINPDPN
jgi:hypothetical protein